jgi:hypothetical protein
MVAVCAKVEAEIADLSDDDNEVFQGHERVGVGASLIRAG